MSANFDASSTICFKPLPAGVTEFLKGQSSQRQHSPEPPFLLLLYYTRNMVNPTLIDVINSDIKRVLYRDVLCFGLTMYSSQKYLQLTVCFGSSSTLSALVRIYYQSNMLSQGGFVDPLDFDWFSGLQVVTVSRPSWCINESQPHTCFLKCVVSFAGEDYIRLQRSMIFTLWSCNPQTKIIFWPLHGSTCYSSFNRSAWAGKPVAKNVHIWISRLQISLTANQKIMKWRPDNICSESNLSFLCQSEHCMVIFSCSFHNPRMTSSCAWFEMNFGANLYLELTRPY